MNDSIELTKIEWQDFIEWYEEKYHYLDWERVSFGHCLIDHITEQTVAVMSEIPEKYYVDVSIYRVSPWNKDKTIGS
jgi:hypothetical protein